MLDLNSKFKEKRLVYMADPSTTQEVIEMFKDIGRYLKDVLDKIGGGLDSGWVRYFGPDKPDPIKDIPFDPDKPIDSYKEILGRCGLLRDLQKGMMEPLEAGVKSLEHTITVAKSKTSLNSIQILQIEDEVEAIRKKQVRFHPDSPYYKEYEGQIEKLQAKKSELIKGISVEKEQKVFFGPDPAPGTSSPGGPVCLDVGCMVKPPRNYNDTEGYSIENALQYLKIELKPLEEKYKYYQDNANRAQYWLDRITKV